MRPSLELLGELISRPPITEAEHWFGIALAKHLYEGLPLNVALRIPGTPARARVSLRDFYVIRAAQALPDMRPRTLCAAVETFLDERWPRWGRLATPPESASLVDGYLWRAQQAYPLPGPDGLTRILSHLRGISDVQISYADTAHSPRKDEQ